MRRVSVALLVLLLLVLAVAAIADTQPTPAVSDTGPQTEAKSVEKPETSTTEAPPVHYRIQPEDVLRITVWGEPNLTGEHVVDPQGNINISLMGQVHAGGLTHSEFVEELRKGLSEWLVDPKIQVTILNFRKPKVHVLGEVNRPGVHEFKYGDRIMEAIAQAGSFRETADLKNARLTRKGETESVPVDLHKLFFDGDMSKNLEIEDGDTVYIPEDTRNKFYVLGEVMRPGPFKLKDDMTVMDAIAGASGPTPRGVLNGTVVVRGANDPSKPSERIKLDLGRFLAKADLTQDIKLEPGDVVYVPETSKPDWTKVSQVVSALFNTSYLFRVLGL